MCLITCIEMDLIPSKEKIEVEENVSPVGEKKAVLIGLKHPRLNIDIKGPIMRMKKQLMDLRGFPEDNITLMIEDEEPSYLQPTQSNILHALCALVYHANPDDILFIYLLAHGCKPGIIVTSDKRTMDEYFFRKLLSSSWHLTIVSDCQIEPGDGKPMCCSPNTEQLDTWTWNAKLIRQILKHDTDSVSLGTYAIVRLILPPVDILKDEQMEDVKSLDQAKHDTVTPISNTVNGDEMKSLVSPISKTLTTLPEPSQSFFGKIGDMLLRLFKSIFSSSKSRISDIPTESSISDSPTKNISRRPIHATLLTAFECDPNDIKKEEEEKEKDLFNYTPPQLFVPPRKVAFSTATSHPCVEHTLYGGFTNVMLDIIEETHGQVTNLELARKAMEKLRMQGVHQKPGLRCEYRSNAYDSFVCSPEI